jgi:hypothetical protein
MRLLHISHSLLFSLLKFSLGELQKVNVPPRLRDGGAQKREDAQGGRVGEPPNFGEIHGGRGDVGVLSIGVLDSKIIKKL